MKTGLLILDDDASILQMLEANLADDNLEVYLERDSEAAIKRILTEHLSVAIIDINLPKKSGV